MQRRHASLLQARRPAPCSQRICRIIQSLGAFPHGKEGPLSQPLAPCWARFINALMVALELIANLRCLETQIASTPPPLLPPHLTKKRENHEENVKLAVHGLKPFSGVIQSVWKNTSVCMYCKCVFTHGVFKMALWFLTVDDFGSPRQERKAAFIRRADGNIYYSSVPWRDITHACCRFHFFERIHWLKTFLLSLLVLISTVIPICISNAYICSRCTNKECRVTGIELKSRARQLFISWCDVFDCARFPQVGRPFLFFYCSRVYVCWRACICLCLILHMHIHGHKANACWKVGQKWGLVVFKSSLTIPVENK